MGGASSRNDTPLPRHRQRHHHHHHHNHHRYPSKASLSSFFSCGLASSVPEPELEDDPVELLMSSSEDGILAKFRNPRKDFALFTAESESTSPQAHTIRSGSNNVEASDIPRSRDGSSDATPSNKAGHLFESGQLFYPHKVVSDNHNSESSSSSMDTEVNDPNTISKDTCPRLSHRRSSSQELGEISSDESPNEIQGTVVINFPNFGSSSTSNVSGSPFSISLRPGSGLMLSERGMVRRDENTLLGDMTSSSSSGDASASATSSQMDNEIRSRRLLCDAFFRHSRGFHDSRNYLFSNDDSDILGFHDRWHNDLNSDFSGEGDGGTLKSYGNGTQGNNNYRQHSRSEVLGSTGGAQDHNALRNSTCPTGIHSRGPCSCESVLRGESSGSRASMSRIVMLAESLFEVLDGIHRQQPSFSLPVVPVPAGESVVNSFPMKNYRRPEESVCTDDAAKCYICLAEYENGDNVRVLPCQHDYHVSCIDKWLKEYHSVCPLCRTDVKEAKSSISTQEFSSR